MNKPIHNLGLAIKVLIVAYFAGLPGVILLSFVIHGGQGILERHWWLTAAIAPFIGYGLIDAYYRYNKSITESEKHWKNGNWKEWWRYYWDD